MAEATGAQTAPAGPAPGGEAPAEPGMGAFMPLLILWLAVIYFFFMRPQKRKEKERKAMIEAVRKGDKVVTIGGIHGVVVKVTDDVVTLRVDDKTGGTMKFSRAAINTINDGKAKDDASADGEETLPAPAEGQ